MQNEGLGGSAFFNRATVIPVALVAGLAAAVWPAAGWAASNAAADEQTETAMAIAGLPLRLIEAATLADRHILIGLTLLAFALMAATTFALWRWQMRGLFAEVRQRDA